MGRTLKRVPLDFDWPLDEIWSGFLPPEPTQCPICGGSGDDDNADSGLCECCEGEGKWYFLPTGERWQPIEPPKGEGYQMWETTTEGSPQSPVFATLDELAGWCEKHASIFGFSKASKAKWLDLFSIAMQPK